MNQTDLLNWFKSQHLEDKEKDFSKRELQSFFSDTCGVGRKVNCLYAFGFLDIKIDGVYGARYKLKSKAFNTKFQSPLDKDITNKELRTLQ
jgi:hypothetical protein